MDIHVLLLNVSTFLHPLSKFRFASGTSRFLVWAWQIQERPVDFGPLFWFFCQWPTAGLVHKQSSYYGLPRYPHWPLVVWTHSGPKGFFPLQVPFMDLHRDLTEIPLFSLGNHTWPALHPCILLTSYHAGFITSNTCLAQSWKIKFKKMHTLKKGGVASSIWLCPQQPPAVNRAGKTWLNGELWLCGVVMFRKDVGFVSGIANLNHWWSWVGSLLRHPNYTFKHKNIFSWVATFNISEYGWIFEKRA